MILHFLILLAFCLSAECAVSLTQLLSLNTNDGVYLDTNALNAFTFGRAAGGRWKVMTNCAGSGGASQALVTTGVVASIAATVFPGTCTITNGSIADQGISVYRYDHNWHSPNGSEYLSWSIPLSANYITNVSVGFYYVCGIPRGNYGNYDILDIGAFGLGFGCSANVTTAAGGQNIRTESTADGVTAFGTNIPINTNYLYWLTYRRDSRPDKTNVTLWVYDPANWSFVGSSSCRVNAANGFSDAAYEIDLGVYDSAASAAIGYSYYGDLMIDSTWSAQFPLLPIANGRTATAVNVFVGRIIQP